MFGASPKCQECGKSVYFAEQFKFQGDYWHKACFTCDRCGKVLPNLSSTHDTKEGGKFCKSCYAKVNGPKGYGYGSTVMQPVSSKTKEREEQGQPPPKPKRETEPSATNRSISPNRMSYAERTYGSYQAKNKNRTSYGGGSGSGTRSSKRMTFGGSPKCPVCQKSVYFAEQRKALGRVYHKSCFKCGDCGKVLGTVAELHDAEGQIFCKHCYSKNFGPKGVGFGNVMRTTGISRASLQIPAKTYREVADDDSDEEQEQPPPKQQSYEKSYNEEDDDDDFYATSTPAPNFVGQVQEDDDDDFYA